jgi:hypothetical protein
MKTIRLIPTLTLGFMLSGAIAASAQVKIGSNPTTITPNANLDVEGVNNRHTVVMQSGHVGIGTVAPTTTFHVQAVEDLDIPPLATNVVARFDPFGGNNVGSSASILVNGGRAMFGYDVDNQASKYVFVKGNQSTDIRLQVMDANATLDSNAFVMSAAPSSLGFVGLNTELPQARLDVRGTTKVLASTAAQTGAIWNGTSNINGFEASTTAAGDAWVGIQRAGSGAPLHLAKPAGAAAGQSFLAYTVNGAYVGTVSYNGSGVLYNNTSDKRLKENIRFTRFGLEALKAVRVYDYNCIRLQFQGGRQQDPFYRRTGSGITQRIPPSGYRGRS